MTGSVARIAWFVGVMTTMSLLHAADARPRLIAPDSVKQYVDSFNQMDAERVVNLIPNAQAWAWMSEQVPWFECPDKDLEKMYYFRWWSYRKHIKQLDFICVSEFLARQNPVSSAVGHHILEGR